jgi:hypothetical protein
VEAENVDGEVGDSVTKIPAVRNWKRELRFLALSGEIVPDHESPTPFIKVLKVVIELAHVWIGPFDERPSPQGVQKGQRHGGFGRLQLARYPIRE